MNILGERFYFKKKPSIKTLVGVTIGMIGIIIIFNDEIFSFSFDNYKHIGLLLALLGTFCASTGNMVHQRNLNNNFPLIETIAFAMLYGSLVTLLITQIKGTDLLFEFTFSYIASLAYLSIIGSIFAFIFYLRLLEKVGPGRAGYVGVVMPVLPDTVRRFRNIPLDESPGEEWDRRTNITHARAAASRCPWLIGSTREKQNIGRCQSFLRDGDRMSAERVLRYEWKHFKRLLRPSHATPFKPLWMTTAAFFRQMYR